jgi:hypothetical protein
MNQIPSETTDCDEAVVSSPTVSTICMKREREKLHVFDHLEQVDKGFDLSTRGGGSDDEDGTTRKKLRLSKEQSALLEESFKDHSTLNPVSCWPYSSDTSCCHVAQDCLEISSQLILWNVSSEMFHNSCPCRSKRPRWQSN